VRDLITPFSVDFGILILTATVLGFILHKFKQPTIVAYLLTGFVLGPAVFNLVSDSGMISLISELGLAFLLFFLGIEMKFGEFEDILGPVSRIAVLQTLMQTSLAFVVAAILGFSLTETVIIALCTVFGATPVIVKLLDDKGELTSLPGRINVGVLVLQDIYVILILALFSADSLSNAWLITTSLLKILSLIGVIAVFSYLSSRYLLPAVFNRVAKSKHAFFVHGIAWAFLFVSLSSYLDLSVEIGAFLAGLGLGQMDYQAELKERVRPLTTFFIVVFFSSIGLQLTLENLTRYWVEALLGGALLSVGNFLIMYYLIRRERFSQKTSFIGSLNMTQTSEFSLVVGGLAVSQGYISGDVLGFLSVMALATMTTSSILIYKNQRLYRAVKQWIPDNENDWDEERDDHSVIVGYDDAVRSLLDVLEDPVLIDNKSEHVEELQRSSVDYIYGDFVHEEMRGKASLRNADLVISVIPSLLINKHILRDTADDTTVILKAMNEDEAAELYDLGADYVIVKQAVMAERLGEIVQAWCDDRELYEYLSGEEEHRVREAVQ
jgi:Kef-type K+ transport system membrane component KefB